MVDELVNEIDESAAENELVEHDSLVVEPAAHDGTSRSFPCHQCGADLAWQAGVNALSCAHCGHREELPQSAQAIQEYAFNDVLRDDSKEHGLGLEQRSVRCAGCGAHTDLAPDVVMTDCAFCGATVEDAAGHNNRIRPEALVPFQQTREQARSQFQQWASKRWFAPNALKQVVADRFSGIYRSWWTFDSHTLSHWSGQAGYYYYVTKTRRVQGKLQTYRQRRVRWRQRSGIYEAFFDDVLTKAFSAGLAPTGYQLDDAIAYTPQALAGFQTERYTIDPQAAWAAARLDIEQTLRQRCAQRLGGDTQRMLTVSTAHSGIAFKSILLPAWHSTYRYRGQVYRIVVNGQTGTVRAERPWSVWKITGAVLAGLVVIAALVVVVNMQT